MNKITNLLNKLYLSCFPSVTRARKLGVRVGDNCRLINVTFSSEPYLVSLGNHVSATNCHFETHDGGVWVFRNERPNWDVFGQIKVGDNVFIGRGCTILPGAKIHDNVVIGAGSVVVGELESNYVYAGVPARKIKPLEDYYNKISNNAVETKKLCSRSKKKHLISNYK